ncbi:ATP-binding protein [Actinokineospora xionganensis]|uniref:ATP-binding protein n=1 Tax=Actinokineospora xionganensis TaxID=2684470 RepID=A0ABR7L0N9_9PSEU|nr:ATP-binding protein [Actinokineospora xionganensis]MBC6445927.1 ATP-binding protein [Actinokineospora xionganensis]
MSPDGDPPLSIDLPTEQLPPLVRVRQWAATALADVGDDHLQAVLLVCTELVTNAYEHAQTACVLRIQHSREPCRVRVEVEDASPGEPVLGRSRFGDLRGRGLVIVDRLSDEWGVTRQDGGKTVWALISCTE